MQIEEAIERARNFKGKRNADMPFVLVPVGEFMMGSEDGYDDEKPVHKQIITEPYWIAVHPVTNAHLWGG